MGHMAFRIRIGIFPQTVVQRYPEGLKHDDSHPLRQRVPDRSACIHFPFYLPHIVDPSAIVLRQRTRNAVLILIPPAEVVCAHSFARRQKKKKKKGFEGAQNQQLPNSISILSISPTPLRWRFAGFRMQFFLVTGRL